ncbi:MAG: tyrosine--tRNA ligase [Deltaproteobacteria bacterium]|nr:tyrosine--tRNA ligase [Deltaproteobacteria bacterium]
MSQPNPTLWSLLRSRGFFQQCTGEEGEIEAAAKGPVTAYTGFDPTASSFHVGHLIPLMAMMHVQAAGHRPILLLGGGTAMIGDPTGKNEMRQMLSREQLEANTQGLRKQAERLLRFGPGQAEMVNNADWLMNWGYIDFLREIGPHFSVNRMLTFETFRTRMETGLSFIEFNYPLLQAFDFLELHKRFGCTVQMGGDDQWANILSGVDLVRRKTGGHVFGWTFPLLTTASGAKMGKTEKGAVWLDPERTSPYDYYQFWVNVDDADTAKCLGFFTQLPMEEVAQLSGLEGEQLRRAKQVLAFEATKIIHGEEEAKRAEAGARALFGGGGDLSQVPSAPVSRARLAEGYPVAEALAEHGMAKTNSEGRRLMEQGGVTVNDQKVTDPFAKLNVEDAQDGAFLLKVGKKKFHRLLVEP